MEVFDFNGCLEKKLKQIKNFLLNFSQTITLSLSSTYFNTYTHSFAHTHIRTLSRTFTQTRTFAPKIIRIFSDLDERTLIVRSTKTNRY